MSESPNKHLDVPALNAIFERSPFMSRMKLEVVSMDHDAARLTVRMPLSPEIERRAGTQQFHGGSLATLIDVVGDFAVGMLVGGGVPTMNLRIDYLRPAIGAYVEATATVRRMGRTSAVVDIDVTSAEAKLVAVGRGTYVPTTG
jgi:uncharacterized protein (TIGR00369 family)